MRISTSSHAIYFDGRKGIFVVTKIFWADIISIWKKFINFAAAFLHASRMITYQIYFTCE